jgi:hypothetical protein
MLANGTCGWLSGELQAAVHDEVAEVAIAGDQRDVVVDAGLGDERIANSGFEALILEQSGARALRVSNSHRESQGLEVAESALRWQLSLPGHSEFR